ncbi:TPA: hypothetical protein PBT65_001725 [Staphylococcus aureus]|nr:hypothetical protein [Staphylococcus aureus]
MVAQTEFKMDLIEIAEIVNEELGFNGINSEVLHQGEEIISVIEAKNHTTIAVEFDILELKKHALNLKNYIVNMYQKYVEQFDVDEEFNMLWSKEFAEHNNFTPSQFLNILEQDRNYFIVKLATSY